MKISLPLDLMCSNFNLIWRQKSKKQNSKVITYNGENGIN